jgi:tight adherence protein C
MLFVTILAIAVCAGLLTFAAAVKAEERLTARAARARLADYEPVVVDKREEALKEPFAIRVLLPALGTVLGLVRRYLPAEYVEKTRKKLVLAGRGQPEDLDRYLIIRIVCVLAVPVASIVVWKLTSLRGIELVAVIVLFIMFGLLGPDAMLNRMVEDRQHKIRIKLPDILDLLTISVEAGLGFEQALNRVVTLVPGPLADEFGRMIGEMRAGSTRADALTALDERTQVPELRSFILALLQADVFGVSVGSILRSQAVEMRIKRRQMAQEQAQKAPVKMLFPMIFCIFPSLFVVIAGPAVIGIYHAFHTTGVGH